jgi:hypothetical protein
VDGRLQVAVIGDVHDELGSFANAQRRAGNRAVVGEHADGRVPDLLGDRADPQLDGVAVGEVDHLRRGRVRQAGGRGREGLLAVCVLFVRVLHR